VDLTPPRALRPAFVSWPGLALPSTTFVAETETVVDGRDKPHGYQDKAQPERSLAEASLFHRHGPDKPGHDGGGKAVLRPTPYPDTHGAKPGHDTKG
jgi:hypothetical protein